MVENRVGTPVRGNDCFGRDRFVELVWQKIAAGHVLLAAPRRFGKTSVMYRLILDEFPMMIDRMARSETHREEAKTLLRWLRKLRLSPDIKKFIS